MFNFDKAVKSKFGGNSLPANIVRVTQKSISVGSDNINKMGTLTQAKSGRTVKLSVEYDAVNQALRIKPDAEGWRCWVTEYGTGYLTKGKTVKLLNILMGDYVPHETEPFVFVLAK